MTNQEELMLAAAVVGIAALVIFSQPSMEKISNQPPESDTKQESETRHKAQAENMKLILRTKTEMRLWAAKGQSFLQKTGPAPEGEDKTDHEWIELTSLIGRAKQLFGRLEGELEEFNRTFRMSFEELEDAAVVELSIWMVVFRCFQTVFRNGCVSLEMDGSVSVFRAVFRNSVSEWMVQSETVFRCFQNGCMSVTSFILSSTTATLYCM